MSFPYLESDRVLLHLLRALPLVCVWRLHAQIQCQLRPCLDLFCAELLDEPEEGPGIEGVSIAPRGCPKQLDQFGRVDGAGEVGVAPEYEGGVGIVDGVVGHIARGRVTIGGLVVGCYLARLAGGRYLGEARRGVPRGWGSLGAAHVAIKAVGEVSGIVRLK